jgi:hypothetical protein
MIYADKRTPGHRDREVGATKFMKYSERRQALLNKIKSDMKSHKLVVGYVIIGENDYATFHDMKDGSEFILSRFEIEEV